jgi:hypothetical protein
VAGALEVLREGGADEAGAAGDEDFHGVLFDEMIIAQLRNGSAWEDASIAP